MSRNEARPKRAFSLLYLATQKFDVSLSSATAAAILGSFLSKVTVVLIMLITSKVSFTYSSSEAAHAYLTGDNNRVQADRDKKSRRRVAEVVVEAVVGLAVSFDLMGGMALGRVVVVVVEVVVVMVVIKVGEDILGGGRGVGVRELK